MAAEAASPGWRVASGTVHVYRLFDVADAIDLGAAEALAAAPTSRFRLERARLHSAMEIPRPPVHLAMGSRSLPLASGERACQLSVNLFDYGVASALYRIPIPPGTTLEELLPLAEELQSPTPEVDAAARREVEEIARGLRAALDRPHAWEGIETYTVFLVQAFDAPPRPRDLLSQETLARLLLGERSRTPLAAAEREDVLKHHFSYLEDDLAVVDWNSAFVLEPSGASDIPDLLEFATAQLLELRYYDALLDRELRRIYDEMEVSGRSSWAVLTRRYLRLQRQTAQLLLELSETLEALENAVKIVGDFYLARLYQAAVRRFRLPAWRETVLRKHRMLAEVNRLLSDDAATRRSELLEVVIILLILWEVMYALLRR
jgi:hypothetical protein